MMYFATFLTGICIGLALAQFTPHGDLVWRAIHESGYSLSAARGLTMAGFGGAVGLIGVVLHGLVAIITAAINRLRLSANGAE